MRRATSVRLGTILAMLTLGISSAAAESPASDCIAARTRAGQHINVWLGGMPAGASAADPYYFAAEDAGAGRFEVHAGAHVCNELVSTRYSTDERTATPFEDYEPVSGRASLTVVHTADPVIVDMPLLADGTVETPVESFMVRLSRPRNGSLRTPSAARFYLIDVDGAERISLGSAEHRLAEIGGIVGIPVFRAGAADSAVSVGYTITATGSHPATAGDDYTIVSANPLTFGQDERVATIDVVVSADDLAEPDETFVVSLDETSPDATIDAVVTIDGEVDATPPRSRFHHPRMGWAYERRDYRLLEMHVFTDDGDGSGVVRIELALRRNTRGGRCAWWIGERFGRAACSEPRWIAMRAYEPGWFYYYRIDPLVPSVRTRIKNYTALARATDAAGNVEVELIAGRNNNTFEVERR